VTLNFVLPRFMPGDPAAAMFARLQGELSPDALDALRRTFGLSDAPLWRQYVDYLGQLAVGDLGTSIVYFPTPVAEVVGQGLRWTVGLAGTSVVVSFALGSALGALAAWWRGGWLDEVVTPLLVLLGAFPYFFLALAASWLFGFQLGWFPVRGAYGAEVSPGWSWAFAASVVEHAALPALTLVVASVGGWTLQMRDLVADALVAEHVSFARARGLSPWRVGVHHAARTALLPSLAGFGMALGFVLSGALLTEVVFAYPGQGWLLLQAVQAQDHALMQGLFLSITVAVLGASFLVDVATVLLDPRVRS
jgi:peptide/nickel transport system permease protein